MRIAIKSHRRSKTARRIAIALLSICGAAAPWCAGAHAADVLTAATRDKLYTDLERDAPEVERFAGVLRKVSLLAKDSVVHIEADKDIGSENRRHVEEAGSGVVVEIDGKKYVITNRHVIKDALTQRIKVRFIDGTELRPEQTWSDADTDLAVLAVRGSNLVAARLGDSDRMEVGDMVMAVGSPFGLSHSTTSGRSSPALPSKT
jgi:serine protease Do